MSSKIKATNSQGKTLTIENIDSVLDDVSITSKDLAGIKSVDTLADLRTMKIPVEKIWVSGYHTKNDGAFGSHIFRLKGVKTTETDNGGTVIIATIGGVDYVYELQFDGAVNVKWFGAVGNDDGLGGGTDSTIAINSACTLCLSSGESLEFPTGNYKVTDTITLENEEFVKSFSLYGQNGNSTRIYFYNSISLKDLFFVDTNVNYLHIRDIEFIDVNRRTSRGFYFRDIIPDSDGALPSWKHKFENVRIYGFKEGVRFDGDTADYVRDAHCSEVMFIHSKIRNCETALIYNNIQAVNHQLIGLDIENDEETASDEWTCIKFERGSTVNHIGGSVIGNGSYIEYEYSEAGGFQDTAQFSANGVRIEKRGGVSPVINHNTNSTIVVSNSFRIILENIPILTPITSNVFGRFGGRTFVKFTNVHANNPMVVEAYITSKLSATVEYGSIQIIDCDKISYSRVSNINAYGGTAILASNYRAIPASINYKNEGKQASVDGDGYINIEKPTQKIYSGYWEVSEIKTLTFSAYDASGLGSGVNPYTELIKLPLYGRPCKFKILRDDINAGSSFVLDLYIVVSGVDHLVASITPTPNVAGYFESNIQTNTGIPLAKFINDGVIWDGKMKIVKSGTVNGFIGLVMIDYM